MLMLPYVNAGTHRNGIVLYGRYNGGSWSAAAVSRAKPSSRPSSKGALEGDGACKGGVGVGCKVGREHHRLPYDTLQFQGVVHSTALKEAGMLHLSLAVRGAPKPSVFKSPDPFVTLAAQHPLTGGWEVAWATEPMRGKTDGPLKPVIIPMQVGGLVGCIHLGLSPSACLSMWVF
jgi:hypothetical protein